MMEYVTAVLNLIAFVCLFACIYYLQQSIHTLHERMSELETKALEINRESIKILVQIAEQIEEKK